MTGLAKIVTLPEINGDKLLQHKIPTRWRRQVLVLA